MYEINPEKLNAYGYPTEKQSQLDTKHDVPKCVTQGASLQIAEGPYPGLWERWWSDRPNERELWRAVEDGFRLCCLHRTTETTFVTLDEEL
jgi:hypothetical protein